MHAEAHGAHATPWAARGHPESRSQQPRPLAGADRIRGQSWDKASLGAYVDASDVREGALEELKPAMRRLVDFVEANEPQLIAYNMYFSDDGATMTVVSVHPDSASLEYHMKVAGPLFRDFVELVTLSSISIYGEPSETVVKQAHEKARLLGHGGVVVEPLNAGFTRVPRA